MKNECMSTYILLLVTESNLKSLGFWFWESGRVPTWKDDILKTPTCNAHYRPWGHEEMNAVHRAQSSAAEIVSELGVTVLAVHA